MERNRRTQGTFGFQRARNQIHQQCCWSSDQTHLRRDGRGRRLLCGCRKIFVRKQAFDLSTVTIKVKPKKLKALPRIERPGEKMWKDHLFKVESFERFPELFEHRLARFTRANPIS